MSYILTLSSVAASTVVGLDLGALALDPLQWALEFPNQEVIGRAYSCHAPTFPSGAPHE